MLPRKEVSWRRLVIAGFGVFLVWLCNTQLSKAQQESFFLCAFVTALAWGWLGRAQARLRVLPAICWLFLVVHYLSWRMASVAGLLRQPQMHLQTLAKEILCAVVLMAELLAVLQLMLWCFVQAHPLQREPLALEASPEKWPEVQVVVAGSGKEPAVIRTTVLGATHLDWPATKLSIAVLDTEKRSDVAALCAETGAAYVVLRPGDLSGTLGELQSPLFALLHAGDVPVRSFLQMTVGWLQRGHETIGAVQTPVVRGDASGLRSGAPEADSAPLGSGSLNTGRDFWNACTCEGTAAVVRRGAIESLGASGLALLLGFADRQLTLQRHGWEVAYLELPQVARIVTQERNDDVDHLSGKAIKAWLAEETHHKGRMPWPQHICGLQAALMRFLDWQFIVLLFAPVISLLFQIALLPEADVQFVSLAASQGLWALLAVVEVCAERTSRNQFRFVRLREERPKWVLGAFLLNLVSVGVALGRLIHVDQSHVHWNPGRADNTLWLALGWAVLNTLVLGNRVSVPKSEAERRASFRLLERWPVRVRFPNGDEFSGETANVSVGGALLQLQRSSAEAMDGPVEVISYSDEEEITLPATVIGGSGTVLSVQFKCLSLKTAGRWTSRLYARADRWLMVPRMRPQRSESAMDARRRTMPQATQELRFTAHVSRAIEIVALVSLVLACLLLQQQQLLLRGSTHSNSSKQTARDLDARAAGVPRMHELAFTAFSGAGKPVLNAQHEQLQAKFGGGPNELIESAWLQLVSRCEADDGAGQTVIVALNGVEIDTVHACELGGGDREGSAPQGHRVELPQELLVSSNELVLTLRRQGKAQCEEPCTAGEVQFTGGSRIGWRGRQIAPKVSLTTRSASSRGLEPTRTDRPATHVWFFIPLLLWSTVFLWCLLIAEETTTYLENRSRGRLEGTL